MSFAGTYRGRRVLVTGDTGFKGGWLCRWLGRLGADVHGLALPPEPDALFAAGRLSDDVRHADGDIRAAGVVEKALRESRPAIVFHLAAQALVRESYREPLATFDTNVMGTARVLDAARRMDSPCAVVVVTSDKCYENRESSHHYIEGDPMGGHDPYSASKGCAELVTQAYRRSFAGGAPHPTATARAGNVIGPGDWAADRILPDIVRALAAGRAVPVRNPRAVRPWQYVLEPLAGYLELGAKLLGPEAGGWAEAWNFGPTPGESLSVEELVELAIRTWGSGRWEKAGSAAEPHEAGLLMLDIGKAVSRLGWKPAWDAKEAVRRTIEGYKKLAEAGRSAGAVRAVMDEQIDVYTKAAQARGVPWAGGQA